MPQAAISEAKKRRQKDYEKMFHTEKPLEEKASLLNRNEKTMAAHLRRVIEKKAAEEKAGVTVNPRPSQAGVFSRSATTLSKHGLEIPLPRSQQPKI